MTTLTCIFLVVHSLALWGGVGYANIDNYKTETTAVGGFGSDIGVGYRVKDFSSGFVFQTGAVWDYSLSNLRYNDFVYSTDMYDTQGEPFTMHFAFTEANEQQQMMAIGGLLRLGYEAPSGYYFLLGTKVSYHFYTPVRTQSTITTSGSYNDLIGEDGSGLLQAMPDHFFYKTNRLIKGNYKPSTKLTLSLEVGKTFSINSRYRSQVLMVGLFADYGFILRGANNREAPRLLNVSPTGEYQPALNAYLWHEVPSFVGQITAGIRVTYLLNRITASCHCF